MNWQAYFNMMIDWKQLPAYKAEPRIDSLVGYYLKDFLSDKLEDQISAILPEFPLRIGTLETNSNGGTNQSCKVDFFAIGRKGINYLIEFKTDSSSRRTTQDNYLDAAIKCGTQAIINGVLRIASVTSFKVKYNYLLNRFQDVGLLNENMTYTGLNPRLEKYYLQPNNKGNEGNVISFEEFADWLALLPDADRFEKEFSETLLIWGKD